MKHNLKTIMIMCISAAYLFTSCKKDAINSNQLSASAEANAVQDTTVKKLVLKPDQEHGEDTYIAFDSKDTFVTTGNNNGVDLLLMYAWRAGNGALQKARSLINFKRLSELETSSKIVSAKLYLYGIPPDNFFIPQGNSYYPGSPYNKYGENKVLVQRITEDWNHLSATWRSQPSSTTAGQDTIAASTSQWNYDTNVDVTDLVKVMVKDKSKNKGFLLKLLDEKPFGSMAFFSAECSDVTKRPKLVVTYK